MLCSLYNLWPLHTVIWYFWVFFLSYLEATKASKILKTTTKPPTAHAFFSKPFDEIYFCSLFLKLQMSVVPNQFSPRKTITSKPNHWLSRPN